MKTFTVQDIVGSFTRALGMKEGYFKQSKVPTIPQRLGNPICLQRWRDPAGESYPEVNGYVDFPKCQRSRCSHPDHPHEVGWRAARAQAKINILKRGLTFYEFFAGKRGVYSGFASERSKNDPLEYAQFMVDQMSSELGLAIADVNVVIASLVTEEGRCR
jgi:hypothetical protein